jgi:hypothetical protein
MSNNDMDTTYFNQAVGFLQRHRAQHLAGDRRTLLNRAVADLRDRHDLSLAKAEDVVIRAYGEVESANHREYIDVSRTTSSLVIIRDPGTGIMRVLTIGDLLRLIGPARHEPLRLVHAATH